MDENGVIVRLRMFVGNDGAIRLGKFDDGAAIG